MSYIDRSYARCYRERQRVRRRNAVVFAVVRTLAFIVSGATVGIALVAFGAILGGHM